MNRRPAGAALVVGLMLAIAACGGSPQRQASSGDPAGGRAHGSAHALDQARALDAQITADLAGLGLTPPSASELTEMMVHAVPALPHQRAALACEPRPVGEACADVCAVADTICDNARQICELADGALVGDNWAARRCASGKRACELARARCCAC